MDLSKLKDLTLEGRPYKAEILKGIDSIDTDDLSIIFPIHYEVSVYATHDVWTLIVTVNYAVQTNCSRCLKEMVDKVSVTSEFLVTETEEDAKLYSGQTEDEVIVWQKRDSYLDELAMSIVITSLPIQPLCSEDCKGLCPICGNDLNKGDCHCSNQSVDSRFAALQGLFDEE